MVWEAGYSTDEVGLAREHCFLDVIHAEAIAEIFIFDVVVLYVLHTDLEYLSNGSVLEAAQ